MHIVLGNDHAAVELKRHVAAHLAELGHTVTDLGTNSAESTDYPIYGAAAARKVVAGEADLGIVICGSGAGISMSANKVPGARCVLASEPYTAKMGRAHNNANLLAMGARVIGPDLATMIVDVFLTTPWEGGERHSRRVGEIAALDERQPIPEPPA
ncbi:MAG: ribose 5-phosphate isomerase B [Propionibacteriaceae bacterium]|jgi:ribose 5-phosphate isomerase B|nr:ribose 5-phosphate isomerase B [Propionibacteriaceae bacterium]